MTRSWTPRISVAYSIAAASAFSRPLRYGGMTFPAVRSSNRSPGPAPVIRDGTTRASEQEMNIACGTTFDFRAVNCSLRAETCSWNTRAWSISDCMGILRTAPMMGKEE
jgi:hypothetical protein